MPAATRDPAPAARRAAGEPLHEVRRSPIQGRGVFARRRIRKGQRIIEYTGEHISHDEGDRRYVEDGMKRHHTFLFTLDARTLIDGKVGGNDSRFINHSCEPNCEAIIEDDRIFIHALRTIQPDEELLYDYQYERTDAHTEEDERFYRCLCGAPSCRGSILAPPKRTRRRAGAGSTSGRSAGGKTGGKTAGKSGRKAVKKVVRKAAGKTGAKRTSTKQAGGRTTGAKRAGVREAASKQRNATKGSTRKASAR